MSDSLRYEVSQFGIDVVLVQPSAYPTELFNSASQPADTTRVAGYGKVGEIPDAMFQNFTNLFESSEAPNLHDIAETILGLIDSPKGSRPARKVVGKSFGADILNDAIAPVQANTIKGLGLAHLETTAIT